MSAWVITDVIKDENKVQCQYTMGRYVFPLCRWRKEVVSEGFSEEVRFKSRPEGWVWMNQVGRRWWEHHRTQRDTRCEGPDRRKGGEDGKTCSSRWQRALWTMTKNSKKLLEHFKNYLTCIWGRSLSTVGRRDKTESRVNKARSPARRLLTESKWRWWWSGLREKQQRWRKADGFEKDSEGASGKNG